MRWSDLPNRLAELYATFAAWSYRNEIELDVVVVVTVLGIIAILYQGRQRKRRRLHRLIWGSIMKRKDRQKHQLMRFSDAIVNEAMNMVEDGDMHPFEEKEWYAFFAEVAKMRDLLPRKPRNPKNIIKRRLSLPWLYGLLKVKIPGGLPVVKPDPSYDPKTSLAKSKFLSPE